MNIDKIKIISLDLDGTLLNNQKEITAYSESVLKRLQEKGYVVVLNSGRFYHEAKMYAEQLQLKEYGGYMCCSNGDVVYDMKKNIRFAFESINKQDAHAVMKLAEKHHLFTYLHHDDVYYANTVLYQRMLFYLAKGITKLLYPILSQKLKYLSPRILELDVSDYQHISSFPSLEKLCFVGLPYQLKAFQKEVNKQFPNYHFFPVNDFSTELVHESVSKANAVAYICEQLECTLENVIAFGDSGNDKPMLEKAGIGVIMKNAKSILHNASAYKSDHTNNDDGVARYLDKYFL